MQKLRVVARLTRLLLVLLLGMFMASLIALGERLGFKAPLERRQRWTCLFMKRLVAALPFNVRVVGELPQRPMLWVSNHVSWTDIPLLGMLLPLSFLSKAEVRHWPVAGWLAEKAGTLFIRRGGGDSQRLHEQIAGQLGLARPLLIFPEGTTTCGRNLRTFMAACWQVPSTGARRCSRWLSSICVMARSIRLRRSLATMIWCRT